MTKRSTQGVVRFMESRKQQLEQRLATFQHDTHPSRGAIEETLDAHAQVASYLATLRRRRSTRWLLGLGAAALAAAALVSRLHLSDPRFVMTASTQALIFSVEADQEIASTTRLSRISHQGAAGAHNLCSKEISERGCTVAESITLQSFTAFSGGEILLRRREQCTDVTFLSGRGRLQVRVHPSPSGSSALPAGQTLFFRVGELETVRYCGAAPSSLVLRDPAFLVVGDSTTEAPSERTLLPATAAGSILFADTGSTRVFRDTDVVQLGGLREAVASIRLEKTLDVTLSARARNIEILRSTLREDARPTWLDFVLGSPDLKAMASLIIGLWVGLNLLRAKLDELMV